MIWVRLTLNETQKLTTEIFRGRNELWIHSQALKRKSYSLSMKHTSQVNRKARLMLTCESYDS